MDRATGYQAASSSFPGRRWASQKELRHPGSAPQAREELRPVRDDFEAKNKQLLDEMPRFYNSRLDYFQPSFESLIRAQVRPCPAPQDGPAALPWGDSHRL